MANRLRYPHHGRVPRPRQFHPVPPPFDPLRFAMADPFYPSPSDREALEGQVFVPPIPRDLRERIRDEIIREEARRRIIEEGVRKEIELERKSRVNCVHCGCNCKQRQINKEERRSEEQSLPKDTTENYLDGNKEKAVCEPQLDENKDQCKQPQINEEERIFEQPVTKDTTENKLDGCKEKALAEPQLEENKTQCDNEEGEIYEEQPLLPKDTTENCLGGNKLKTVAEPHLEQNKDQCEKEEERISQEQSLPKDTTENYLDVNKEKAMAEKDQSEKEAETWGAKRKVEHLPITNSEESGPKTTKKKICLKEFKCPKCQVSMTGEKAWRTHINGKSCEKEAETSEAKRKIESLPITSTEVVGLKRRKKQKGPPKEVNCTLCQITLANEQCWTTHVNGKKHRRKAGKSCVVKTNLEEKKADEKLEGINLKEGSIEKNADEKLEETNLKEGSIEKNGGDKLEETNLKEGSIEKNNDEKLDETILNEDSVKVIGASDIHLVNKEENSGERCNAGDSSENCENGINAIKIS